MLVFTLVTAAPADDRDDAVKPVRFLDLHSSLPAAWQSVAPASSMRAAQVTVLSHRAAFRTFVAGLRPLYQQ